MDFRDLETGQRLRQVNDPGDRCTVVAVGVSCWAVRYDGASDKTYAYQASDAKYFKPVPEPDFGEQVRAWEGIIDHPLAEHPAVLGYGEGITVEDLASFTECLSSLAQSRSDHHDLSPDEMAVQVTEDAADAITAISLFTAAFLSIASKVKAGA